MPPLAEWACMPDPSYKVLLANENRDDLRQLADLVERAGHEVVALAISAGEAGDAIVEHSPEMAMIIVEGDEDHALELMVEIRSFAEIPLVVLAHSISEQALRHAADHAMEVLHLPGEPETVARVIRLAAERHSERQEALGKLSEIEGMLERRSTIEQAKGILMERHGIDAIEAFDRIREHARTKQLRVVDVAASIITARSLLAETGVEAGVGE